MWNVTVSDNVHGYKTMLEATLDGRPVSPRGQRTYELEDVTIRHIRPDDVLAVGCGRGLNTRLAAYESLALIAGVSLPRKAVNVAPNLAQFINPATSDFDGAYGPRLREQIPWIITKLQDDAFSRQAVATIYRPSDLTAHSLDVPCTVYVRFALRNGRLRMKTHMRSQDLWWGWPYDVVQFTQLGWTIAHVLGTTLEQYVHHVDSLHMYERDISKIENFLLSTREDKARPLLSGLKVDGPWSGVREVARMMLMDDVGSWRSTDYTENWFAQQKLWEA